MVSLPFSRRKRATPSDTTTSQQTERPHTDATPTRWQLHRATRTRKTFALLTSFFLFLTLIFLILVETGNTHRGSVLTSIYFLNLDLSEIVPQSFPGATFRNTIAQTLGLHDFYRVGLWNFCEGYMTGGVTFCSDPKPLYWFNPVQILESELFAGASVAIPNDINDTLKLVKEASQYMFAFFMTGVCFSTILIFMTPLSLYTRWAALPIAILTLLNAACIAIATAIATAMFIIFRNVATSVADLNIEANIGGKMFAFMWLATSFAIFSWLIQTGLCCCCASRRDVKTGKKRGSKHAWENTPAPTEKPPGGRFFGLGKSRA